MWVRDLRTTSGWDEWQQNKTVLNGKLGSCCPSLCLKQKRSKDLQLTGRLVSAAVDQSKGTHNVVVCPSVVFPKLTRSSGRHIFLSPHHPCFLLLLNAYGQGLIFLLSPVFLSDKIKDGCHSITNIKRQLSHIPKHACIARYSKAVTSLSCVISNYCG